MVKKKRGNKKNKNKKKSQQNVNNSSPSHQQITSNEIEIKKERILISYIPSNPKEVVVANILKEILTNETTEAFLSSQSQSHLKQILIDIDARKYAAMLQNKFEYLVIVVSKDTFTDDNVVTLLELYSFASIGNDVLFVAIDNSFDIEDMKQFLKSILTVDNNQFKIKTQLVSGTDPWSLMEIVKAIFPRLPGTKIISYDENNLKCFSHEIKAYKFKSVVLFQGEQITTEEFMKQEFDEQFILEQHRSKQDSVIQFLNEFDHFFEQLKSLSTKRITEMEDDIYNWFVKCRGNLRDLKEAYKFFVDSGGHIKLLASFNKLLKFPKITRGIVGCIGDLFTLSKLHEELINNKLDEALFVAASEGFHQNNIGLLDFSINGFKNLYKFANSDYKNKNNKRIRNKVLQIFRKFPPHPQLYCSINDMIELMAMDDPKHGLYFIHNDVLSLIVNGMKMLLSISKDDPIYLGNGFATIGHILQCKSSGIPNRDAIFQLRKLEMESALLKAFRNYPKTKSLYGNSIALLEELLSFSGEEPSPEDIEYYITFDWPTTVELVKEALLFYGDTSEIADLSFRIFSKAAYIDDSLKSVVQNALS